MRKLIQEYGSLEGLHMRAKDPKDLKAKLKEFKGLGPVDINIFLRELRGIWGEG